MAAGRKWHFAEVAQTERRYRYCPGEHRKKHKWQHPEPGFVPSGTGYVGKCPNSMTMAEANELLNAGVGVYADPAAEHPKWIYTVSSADGVVYEAVPTRVGRSYHGYPARKSDLKKHSVPERIVLALARSRGCEQATERWLKANP